MPNRSRPDLKYFLKNSLFLLPVIFLFILHGFLNETFLPPNIALDLLFCAGVLGLSWLTKDAQRTGHRLELNWIWLLVVGIGLAGGITAGIWRSSLGAWAFVWALFALSLGYHAVIGGRPGSVRYWLIGIITGGAVSLIVVVFNQVLTRFSDEEFFTAVQAVLLFLFWLTFGLAVPFLPGNPRGRIRPVFRIGLPSLLFGILLLLGFGGAFVVKSYQSSFYAPTADVYPGISHDRPFLCGTADPAGGSVPGRPWINDYLQRISKMPDLDSPSQAFLYLASGDLKWAAAFHDQLLAEAGSSLFTAPANSVKYDQHLAALRVYAYVQVRSRKPDLFSGPEQTHIENWFHAINRRAMTVEWVDWMYGLAFSANPAGPYENQENGAGLIALLEAENLADPGLSQQNKNYLARNPRGWAMRFRNTDDSNLYQSEWITNAYFQEIFTGSAPSQNIKNSFEWILLSMLPDGRAPQFNLPEPYNLASTMVLGAGLLKDGRFLWMAERSLKSQIAPGTPLYPRSGLEELKDLTGESPPQGTCLIYGDSGLPTQKGPLAPDKLVFRAGWSSQDAYLLLNLRFAGWHRYKGTNTVTLIDRAGPLVNEQIEGEAIPWLPKGRSAFRDKRIPRQNLNGLQLDRQGLDAVLYALLGYGGPWAQDPPPTAHVDAFSTGAEMDISQTSLIDWQGWNHSRKIYFRHDGIIAIHDQASGPAGQAGSITWNIVGKGPASDGRFLLDNQAAPGEMVLLSKASGTTQVKTAPTPEGNGSSRIFYSGSPNGRLDLATVFLTGDWLGAKASLLEISGKEYLSIEKPGKSVRLEWEAMTP